MFANNVRQCSAPVDRVLELRSGLNIQQLLDRFDSFSQRVVPNEPPLKALDRHTHCRVIRSAQSGSQLGQTQPAGPASQIQCQLPRPMAVPIPERFPFLSAQPFDCRQHLVPTPPSLQCPALRLFPMPPPPRDRSFPKTHSRPEPTAPAHAPKDWSAFLPGSPPPHTADTAFVAPAPSRLHRPVPRLRCSSSIPAPCPNPRRLDTNSSDNCAVALPVPAPAADQGAHARPGDRLVVPAYPNQSALSAPGSNAHIASAPDPIPPAPPQWL